MVRHPILVAVDGSPEAVSAAEFGCRLALAAGTRCLLVHAVRDPWTAALVTEVPETTPQFTGVLLAAERARVSATLRDHVPSDVLAELSVQAGRPADVIADLGRALGADLIVMGGKHHSVLGRWFGGSTVHNVARTTTIPMLVTVGKPERVRRVLVALDTSGAAALTLEAARHFARTYAAELRAVSVIEPLPVMPESGAAMDPAPYVELCRETIESELRPLVAEGGAELVIRVGPTAGTIEEEAKAWEADLVVVGSHGKSWTERLMLGSVTERLLSDLPTSLVVVPVAVRVPAAVRSAAYAPALTPAIG